MAIKFEKIQAGMTLYDRHRHKVGNVKGRTEMGQWPVKVLSVNPDDRTALVSWNSNRAEQWPERRLTKLYASKKTELD